MKIYNKYFVCALSAIMLAGCEKNKDVDSSVVSESEEESAESEEDQDEDYVEKSNDDNSDATEEVAESEKSTHKALSECTTRYYFAFDGDKVLSESGLDDVAEALNGDENREKVVIIYGNCDQRGSAAYNVGLGSRRANAVKNALVSRGVSASRFKVISLGQMILVEGDSQEAYAKNRVGIIELEGAESSIKGRTVTKPSAPKVEEKSKAAESDEDESEDEDDSDN